MRTITVTLALLSAFIIFTQNTVFSQSDVNEHSIKFQNDQVATLVGEDGVILGTSDGGISWNQQNSGVTNVLYGNAIVDQNIAFAVGENGIILRTINGGINWILCAPLTLENLKKIVVTNSSVVTCGDNGTILVSHDMGKNWTLNNLVTANNLNYVTAAGQILFMVGANSTVIKSVDGGDSWSQIAFNFGSINFESIAAIDENTFTIVGDGFTNIRTTNGGETWLGIGTNNGNINLNEVVFFNATDGVIVGDQGLILNTTDAGSTWQISEIQTASMTPVSRSLMSVAFSSLTNGITIGENGAHYYSGNGGITWTDMAPGGTKNNHSGKKNTQVQLNQNFPNPFNPSTSISYNLPFDASVSLKIYDMLGREVKSVVNDRQSAGNYSFRFDASNLASGIYFYVLRATGNGAEFSKTMRMILTK
jgi:photosystem II stability/assembly factor-like uncharacterized protein